MKTYHVMRVEQPPEPATSFDAPAWKAAPCGEVASFHAASSDHHPKVRFRMLRSADALHLKFHVSDRYVLARRTRPHDFVCNDSCVEFLTAPEHGEGYVSFEMNCIGTLLSYHIRDWRRVPGGFASFDRLPEELFRSVTITTTCHEPIEQEIASPMEYEVGIRIPFTLFEVKTGSPPPHTGSRWRGNFFKCADESSHPHWASWQSIGKELNFHQPDYFGELLFL